MSMMKYAINEPGLATHDNPALADVLFSPVGDPELVKKMGAAFSAYLDNLPPGDKRPPFATTATTYRVTKADGVPTFKDALLILVWRKRRRLWGIYRYVDGQILPGDGVDMDDLVRWNN